MIARIAELFQIISGVALWYPCDKTKSLVLASSGTTPVPGSLFQKNNAIFRIWEINRNILHQGVSMIFLN